MQRTPWIDRKFTFDFPTGWLPNILERLHGTPIRIANMISGISTEHLTSHANSSWSIQQHIGHLLDLEDLHDGRITDFLDRKTILRAADMANSKTNAANHNEADIATLLQRFTNRREQFIRHLTDLDDATQSFTSLHPRLQVQVRPVDIAYFTAEHDDHHLATMRSLL
jgi:uncharacterized damage-inducible protein DinB